MKQYVVDAFTNQIFKGNPAAVCILDEWINEEVMLNIAIENNLSETAFAVKNSNQYEIRWFTPGGEVDLCGHATLATAFVILNFYENTDEIYFKTIDNIQLSVKRRDTLYEMEFPAYDLKSVNITDEIINALGVKPNEIFKARDLLCVLDSPQSVIDFKPNLDKIEKLEGLLLHITAKGKEYDCVSRSFGPKLNIPEDPVCGSGHCHIVPYWSEKLNDKVLIAGEATLFSESKLNIK